MMQHYQDAMSIVCKFVKPDLFVTMTCNPKWREISENLLPGQTASDRPDLVARVFNIKKNALIDTIVKKQLFGEIAAYIWVIEFQKRGLPHLHMLITLKSNSKITRPEQVDRLIPAEIPDPVIDPTLFDIVTKNILHGPCGGWCLIDGICSKKYTNSFRNETTMDADGYLYYRRRDEGIRFTRNSSVFDNRHVVPYNPELLKAFNCHINVEVVCSITAVKYLFKYVYKSYDKAAIIVNGSIPNTTEEAHASHDSRDDPDNFNTVNDYDEIRNFVDARYVGPVEAVWRIISKDLQDKSHSIIRLPVHLPNEQSITINDNCTKEELQEALEKKSMLIDFFKLNERDPNARQYVYGDIPNHYVFKKTIRLKLQVDNYDKNIITLLDECAKSFEELRTVNGTLYDSFTSTCLAAGLIEDDQEWRRTLNEAIIWMMPRQLRCLFVRILIHCQPLRPEDLWEEFKGSMSEDYKRRFGAEEGEKKAYIYINSMLNREGQSLSTFPNMIQINEIDDGLLDGELLQTVKANDSHTMTLDLQSIRSPTVNKMKFSEREPEKRLPHPRKAAGTQFPHLSD
ncbi:uncharacterized protein LOC123261436 [Cotesia glomerata]|uniref:uncharacterized protein LOC123261436 n=1 Tax=Cotesia glomerata TaxID=32391 RepID=UPI001D00EEAE|nr:uncharacterized protein LOC123261436 [Cotesia glomerata]